MNIGVIGHGRTGVLSTIEQEILKGNIKHDLKLSSQYYDDVMRGCKRFELRENDRDYQVGDVVVLREYDNGQYTGRYFIQVIGYILKDCPQYGLMDGYCIFGW